MDRERKTHFLLFQLPIGFSVSSELVIDLNQTNTLKGTDIPALLLEGLAQGLSPWGRGVGSPSHQQRCIPGQWLLLPCYVSIFNLCIESMGQSSHADNKKAFSSHHGARRLQDKGHFIREKIESGGRKQCKFDLEAVQLWWLECIF